MYSHPHMLRSGAGCRYPGTKRVNTGASIDMFCGMPSDNISGFQTTLQATTLQANRIAMLREEPERG
jgi:hypothetical protein